MTHLVVLKRPTSRLRPRESCVAFPPCDVPWLSPAPGENVSFAPGNSYDFGPTSCRNIYARNFAQVVMQSHSRTSRCNVTVRLPIAQSRGRIQYPYEGSASISPVVLRHPPGAVILLVQYVPCMRSPPILTRPSPSRSRAKTDPDEKPWLHPRRLRLKKKSQQHRRDTFSVESHIFGHCSPSPLTFSGVSSLEHAP